MIKIKDLTVDEENALQCLYEMRTAVLKLKDAQEDSYKSALLERADILIKLQKGEYLHSEELVKRYDALSLIVSNHMYINAMALGHEKLKAEKFPKPKNRKERRKIENKIK